MPGFEIVLLALLAGGAWLWLDSLKARELAVKAARRVCEAESLLLLDDTVAIAHLKLKRDENGQAQLQRSYEFEYSDTGNNRLSGSIVMLGKRVLLINVGARMPENVRTLH